MIDRFEITPDFGAKENTNIIKVIGVGGGGSNAVKHMYSEGIVGVDFLICNTDQGHLSKSPIPDKLLLGHGLGAGAKPELACQYANESKDKIVEFIGKNTKMLFITAGMGKGTGTGASPVIAQVAHEMGILTIGVVTYPFEFEGQGCCDLADNGISELSKYVDSLIVVKNENILKFYQDDDLLTAYGHADDVLKNAVKCIAELITVNYSQNVDFNDIQTIMKESGKAMLGLSIASGEDRVEKVVEDALDCPLLDNSKIADAKNFLFFISYGPDSLLKVSELTELTKKFKSFQNRNTRVIWGHGQDDTLGDAIKLSVIITNFNPVAAPERPVITNEQTQDQIFDTTQKVAARVIDRPSYDNFDDSKNMFGNMPAAPTVDSQNDVVEFPKSEIFDAARTQNPGNQVKPAVTPISDVMPSQPTQIGPQRIEDNSNILFSSEQDFQNIVTVPTIMRQATMQEAAKTATMDFQSIYQVENDMKDFFADIAD